MSPILPLRSLLDGNCRISGDYRAAVFPVFDLAIRWVFRTRKPPHRDALEVLNNERNKKRAKVIVE